jgi:hypothetical protein
MALINKSILVLITVLHLIIVLFIIITPFTNSNYLLLLYIITVPFIILHWIMNNNTCSLTVAEKYIRQKTYGVILNDDECFTYNLIAPIYDFNKNYETFSNFIYIATFSLLSLASYKFYKKIYNGEIKNINYISKF